MSENNVEKTNDNKTCDTCNNKNSHKTNTVAALCIAPSGVGEELSEYVADLSLIHI